jgi:Lrp/AsnC family transcriptional regulator, regulator for asnA, asnC and gidA
MVESKRPSNRARHTVAAVPVDHGALAAIHNSVSTASLDATDLAIIRILQDDGRAAFTSIAKQLEISEGAVRNRIGQLMDSKVLRIIGVADPVALGYDAFAMIGLKVAPGIDPQDAALYFRDKDEVTYILFVAGRYDLLVEVICETQEQLALFLREHCYSRSDLTSVEPMVGLAMYKSMLKWGQP